MVGMTLDNESKDASWYNRFARFPYYGQRGLNSGVMLMNLTRIRLFNWNSYMWPLLRVFKSEISLGDQDLINILLHYHSHEVYVLPCAFNYRPEFCDPSDLCRTPNGIQVLHGNSGRFHIGQNVFTEFYRFFTEYKLYTDFHHNVLRRLESMLNAIELKNFTCGNMSHRFLNKMRQSFPTDGEVNLGHTFP